MTSLHALFAVLALCSAVAAAEDVYKCTNADGDVAYQDRPCPAPALQSQLHLPDAPPPANATTPVEETTAAPPPPKPATEPAPPRVPLPSLFICRNAEDGSTYFSENDSPLVRYVPLGALGFPGKSLGQAYGPRGGSGISAPGVNKIPIGTSPRDAIASQLTAVQDVCTAASTEQTCGYLREQYDSVEHKLKRAFRDERAVLEPRERELEAQLDNC